jgi:hypothetical protein
VLGFLCTLVDGVLLQGPMAHKCWSDILVNSIFFLGADRA